MKIQLNSNEVYTINIKESITLQELQEILYRLNSIAKVFGKDVFNSSDDSEKPQSLKQSYTPRKKKGPRGKGTLAIMTNTREKTIELLKLKYYATPQQKEYIFKMYNIDSADFSKMIYIKQNKYNILPKECGLKKYFYRGEVLKDNNKDQIFIAGFNYDFPPQINFLEVPINHGTDN